MSISLPIFSRDACAAALRALCVMWYVDQMTPRNTINNNTKKSLCYSIKGWFSHNMTCMLRMNRVCGYTKRQLCVSLLRMTITKCFILHRITLPTINLDLVVDDFLLLHAWMAGKWMALVQSNSARAKDGGDTKGRPKEKLRLDYLLPLSKCRSSLVTRVVW